MEVACKLLYIYYLSLVFAYLFQISSSHKLDECNFFLDIARFYHRIRWTEEINRDPIHTQSV